jgi:hypothetical protein
VVSFGVGCARLNYPSVYANVATYSSWIQANRPAARRPSHLAGSAASPPTRSRRASNPADEPGALNGCPADAVCLYLTDQDLTDGTPAVYDSQLLYNYSTSELAIPQGNYAALVNNTATTDPSYASAGDAATLLAGDCAYLPTATSNPGHAIQLPAIPINMISVHTSLLATDTPLQPCPDGP